MSEATLRPDERSHREINICGRDPTEVAGHPRSVVDWLPPS